MKRKTIARKHHYLPQAYLAAFTDNGSKKGRFYVLNLETGKCFRTSPQNVAAIRDFNRVNMDGRPPDVLEQALSNGEQRMSEACRKVDSLRTFPSDEDYSYILNLICLLAVRDPQRRKTLNRAREQTIRIIESMLVSDPKIYEHHLKKAIEAGKLSQKEACAVSFEDLKQFVGEGEYEIKFLPEEEYWGSGLVFCSCKKQDLTPCLLSTFYGITGLTQRPSMIMLSGISP